MSDSESENSDDTDALPETCEVPDDAYFERGIEIWYPEYPNGYPGVISATGPDNITVEWFENPRIKKNRTNALAFCMAQHARLGANSIWSNLTPELMAAVFKDEPLTNTIFPKDLTLYTFRHPQRGDTAKVYYEDGTCTVVTVLDRTLGFHDHQVCIVRDDVKRIREINVMHMMVVHQLHSVP